MHPAESPLGLSTEDHEKSALVALFRRGSTAMAVLGLDGRFLSVNDSFCRMLDYSREELLGMNCLEVTAPQDHGAVAARIANLAGGKTDGFVLEKHCVRRDGSVICVQNSVALTRDPGGRPLNFIAVCNDVTGVTKAEESRRVAEERLKRDQERFHLVSEAAQVGFWFCDLPFDRLEWDARVKEHFWLAPETEVTIDLFYEQLHPEDRERTRQEIAHSIDAKQNYDIQYRTLSPKGDLKWIRAMGRGFYDEHGAPTRFDGVTLDVTALKLSEMALKETGQRLQASLDAAGAGTFRWNMQTNELDWDENLDALFGLPRGETIRSLENFVAVVHPDERQRVIDRCVRCAQFGADFSMEFRVIWPDGTIRWLDDRGRSYLDEAGRPLYMMGACLDITEQRAAEEALIRAKEEAERASQAKDHFLAALSHELRTPLAPVLMTAGALRQDERLTPEVRGEMAMIERNIGLEARLIDDLLDLTRIGKGKLSLHPEWSDAHSLIALAAEIVREEALTKRLNFELNLAAEESGVFIDPTRFQQVIWNLIRNAVKFTPANGRVSVVTSNVGEDGHRKLRVEVRDTGIGIAAHSLESIFSPFEQGEGHRGGHLGGLGLGLAIARAITELHGGTVRAESEGIACGATFIVELPNARKIDPVAGNSAAPSAQVSGAPLRLLLVEDNETTLDVLSRLLVRSGHRVMKARTCAEALAAARSEECDAVISDLGLPDGTGIELMAQLRALYRLPGIALSGYGMEEDMLRARQAGFSAHLVKPVDYGNLQRAISELTIASADRRG